MSRVTVRRVLATRVVTPNEVLGPCEVTVVDGSIAALQPAIGPTPPVTLVPGFVDMQVNGAAGIDVASADGADWDAVDEALIGGGTTTWCPTLITAPLDAYDVSLGRISRVAAQAGLRPSIAGAHLEGPFLALPGAHPVEHLRVPDADWLSSLPAIVRVVTLAPELPGAIEAIRALAGRGVVVAVGHSAADHDSVVAAADAGASLVTHLFNGCGPFHHRSPGVVGAALGHDNLAVSLVADLEHVHPAALALALAARAAGPTRTVLVSDTVAGPTRDGNGRLVGSRLTMHDAVRNLVDAAGVGLIDAVAAATANPARLLGLPDRGRVALGLRADLCALDEDMRPVGVWIKGEPVLVEHDDLQPSCPDLLERSHHARGHARVAASPPTPRTRC